MDYPGKTLHCYETHQWTARCDMFLNDPGDVPDTTTKLTYSCRAEIKASLKDVTMASESLRLSLWVSSQCIGTYKFLNDKSVTPVAKCSNMITAYTLMNTL